MYAPFSSLEIASELRGSLYGSHKREPKRRSLVVAVEFSERLSWRT